MKIVVAGIGYVGLSKAVLLAARHSVTMLDIDHTSIDLVNDRRSLLVDPELEDVPAIANLNLTAARSNTGTGAHADADFIIASVGLDPRIGSHLLCSPKCPQSGLDTSHFDYTDGLDTSGNFISSVGTLLPIALCGRSSL